jgi:hypothetical protein
MARAEVCLENGKSFVKLGAVDVVKVVDNGALVLTGDPTDDPTLDLKTIETGGQFNYPAQITTDKYGRVTGIVGGSEPLATLKGTTNQVTVAPDSVTQELTVSLPVGLVAPGNITSVGDITSGGTITSTASIVSGGNITANTTGYVQIAVGTTAQRPTNPKAGMIRINTDL